jgi:hypothetical protein
MEAVHGAAGEAWRFRTDQPLDPAEDDLFACPDLAAEAASSAAI